MKLLGMLDSPYVRRTAITLKLLGVAFEHQPLSVFRQYDAFRGFNPVVKAPTLVLDDGSYLMDSTLIIDYVEHVVGRSLLPSALEQRLIDTRFVALGLATCDKAVQIVYEHTQRPAEKQHAPWLSRVTEQMLSACDALETLQRQHPLSLQPPALTQGSVTVAVAWRFVQLKIADIVPASRFPRLNELSGQAEKLAEFRAFAPD
ncbi:MAG: glutathione S-transferase N-terminal domain-containing protein [Burkholderiaceae bacterium]